MLLEINEGLESVGSTLVEVTHQCQEAEEGIDTSLDGLDGSFEQFAATLEGRLAACGQSHHDLTEQLSAFVVGTDQYVKAVNQETDGLVEQLGAMIGGLEEPLQTIFANSVEPEIGEFLDAVDGLEFAIVETENQIISLIENDLEVATDLRDSVDKNLEKLTDIDNFSKDIDFILQQSDKVKY